MIILIVCPNPTSQDVLVFNITIYLADPWEDNPLWVWGNALIKTLVRWARIVDYDVSWKDTIGVDVDVDDNDDYDEYVSVLECKSF